MFPAQSTSTSFTLLSFISLLNAVARLLFNFINQSRRQSMESNWEIWWNWVGWRRWAPPHNPQLSFLCSTAKKRKLIEKMKGSWGAGSSLLLAGCRGAAAPLTHPKRTQLPEENKASRELRRNSSSSIIHFIHNWFHWTVPLGGTKDKSIQFNQLHPFSKNGVELNLNLICCAA